MKTNRNARPKVVEQTTLLGESELVVQVGNGPKRRLPIDPRWRVGFAAALALVVETAKQEDRQRALPCTARCPHCGRVGDLSRDFGTRVMGGKTRRQSWCRACRASRVTVRTHGQQELLA